MSYLAHAINAYKQGFKPLPHHIFLRLRDKLEAV